MKKNKTIVGLSLFVASVLMATELKNTSVTFEATGKPSFIKIKGDGTKLTHTEKKDKDKKVDFFEFEMADLKSGIDLRDFHMKEKYLKTKEFPKATLALDTYEVSIFELTGEREFRGVLTLKGESKPVTIKAKKNGNEIVGKFEIKLTDFGIEIPEWSGIKVADVVKVKSSFEPVVSSSVLAR